MRTTIAWLTGLMLTCPAFPVAAHHSFAIFDFGKVMTMRGTVKAFDWSEPHAWLDVTERDQSGREITVSFQCLGPEVLTSKGWTKDTLQPGEPITVNYFPNRYDRPGGALRTVTLPNGAVMASYDFTVSGSSDSEPGGGPTPAH